jgi:hypothetical protein
MKKLIRKKGNSLNIKTTEHNDSVSDVFFNILIIILGVFSAILFVPTVSGFSVFSRGDFAFITAIGSLGSVITALVLIIRAVVYRIRRSEYLTNTFRRIALLISMVIVGVTILLFSAGIIWISYEVQHQCEYAKREYSGTCVQALLSLLDDEDQPYALRNSAIWTLGQLGDTQALPTLQRLYTGVIPSREPLHDSLSQYELRKAMKLLSGELNIPALFWR